MRIWAWVSALMFSAGILFGVAGSPAMAEVVEEQLSESYWKGYYSDTKSILLSPLDWENKDWAKAALVAGTTIALIKNDQNTQDFFQEHRTEFSDHAANLVENFGDPKVVIPALALVYGYGQLTDNPKAQEVGLFGVESAIIALGGTYSFKLLTHRSRPKNGEGPEEWDGASTSFSDRHLSFPSGHSAVAFSTATVFATVYGDIVWVPYLSYGLATGVAFSRVNDNNHWSSDVFFGSILGWYTAKSIMARRRTGETTGLDVFPIVTKNGFGLFLNYRFKKTYLPKGF